MAQAQTLFALPFVQGAAQAMTVVASAIGPLLLAWCVELTGSYAGMFTILAGIIVATALAALVTPLPSVIGGQVKNFSPEQG